LANKKAFFKLLLFTLLIIAFLYSNYIGLRNLFRYNGFKKELQAKQLQLDELMTVNQDYKHSLVEMQKDEFWILEIKKNLGFIRNNERVYKFYE